MATHARGGFKVISSIKFCEEKFSCSGDHVEAEFECEECKSSQCSACETKLHELAKFVFHDRKRLQPVSANRLCQLSCENRNFANVKCESCALNYCYLCFEKMHSSGKRKLHKKVHLTEALLQSQQMRTSKSSSFTSDDYFDATKPDSPTSSPEEGSLAYLSMNQDIPGSFFPAELETKMSSIKIGLPDVAPELTSLSEHSSKHEDVDDITSGSSKSMDDEIYTNCKSFLLIDQQENIQVGFLPPCMSLLK